MFGVTLYGVMRNLTQVESLNAQPNPKVYTLAVLKPNYEEVIRVNPNWEANPSFRYPEITYPLSYPLASNAELDSSRKVALRNTPDEREQGTETSVSPLAHIANKSSHNSASTQDGDANQKGISGRDQLAKRTFSILQMKAGDNPWDLGSKYRNVQTVMGTSIIDWFLPFKRSPCCMHEDSQSQFTLGPSVDLIIASLYFKEASDPDLDWNTYPQAMRDYLTGLRLRRTEKYGVNRRQKRRISDVENGLHNSHPMKNLPSRS